MKPPFFNALFRFFSSIKLAVVSLLLLAGILAVATVLESYYGMRAVHVMIYGTPWFGGVLFLLGLNVLCAALSRYPWKRHQTGFVITHAGIITILIGSVVTQRWGVDGNLPVVEGTEDNRVILNDLVVRVTDEKTQKTETYFVPESAKRKDGEILTFVLGNGSSLVVDSFLPRAIQQRNITSSPVAGVGQPAIKLRLFNSRFQIEEWLTATSGFKPTELNLGPAMVTFEQLWTEKEETQFRRPVQNLLSKPGSGVIAVKYQGKEFRLPVQGKLGVWQPLGASQLEVQVTRYLPYAIVEKNELVSRSLEPINPAVQLQVRKKGASTTEKHTVFAFFPEFTTMHGHRSAKEKLGVELKLEGFKPPRENLMGVGNARGELKFAQGASGKKLFYRVHGKDGAVNGSGEVEIGKVIPTGWMDLQFEVMEWLPHSVTDFSPRYVEQITGGDNYLTAIRVRAFGEGVNQPPLWLYEGMARAFSLAGRDLSVSFEKETLELPFKIYLDKFTIGTDPGTSKAASYQSQVRVKNEGRDLLSSPISMNEPLKHGGYTFYQASYQMEEGRPPVSIFSVNYDPGRWIKYLGSILLTLGAVVMFAMNPHYFSVLVGKKPRSK